MTDITNITASQRVLAHLREGRLVQWTWHREQDGRELACVLGAISPDIVSDTKCPASVMPLWLSPLTVFLFDGQTKAEALAWAGRFGAQMGRWHALDSAAWDRVLAAFCAACVADAQRSADSAAGDWAVAAATAVAWAAAAAAAAAAYAAAAYADAACDSCWTRLATAICDLIDAELAASAAKGTL